MHELLTNPTFLAAVIPSILYLVSEALPFLPVRAQGIVHGLVQLAKAVLAARAAKSAADNAAFLDPRYKDAEEK